MIAISHVAFVWAVGISNVKQLLTSLVSWHIYIYIYIYIYISARGLLHLCHANVSSEKKQFFLLQLPLKILLPKYICIHGDDDRPHYRVSNDGRFIVVSFILIRYMYTEIGQNGNTIVRYMPAIQHTPLQYTNLNPNGRRPQPNATDREYFKITLITIIHQRPYQLLPCKCLPPAVWECKRHAGNRRQNSGNAGYYSVRHCYLRTVILKHKGLWLYQLYTGAKLGPSQ